VRIVLESARDFRIGLSSRTLASWHTALFAVAVNESVVRLIFP